MDVEKLLREKVTNVPDTTTLMMVRKDQVTALLDRLAALTAELESSARAVRKFHDALNLAEARVAALTAALVRYGQHERDCAYGHDAACDCGYQAALDAAGGA